MRILIAYDGSECAEVALADLTRAGLPHRAEVLVFAVVELWLPHATFSMGGQSSIDKTILPWS